MPPSGGCTPGVTMRIERGSFMPSLGVMTTTGPAASVWWIDRAGHVGFPPRVSVDRRVPAPLEEQILDWLDGRAVADQKR